jgi:type IV secretory pathway VirB10-like protein
MVEQNPEAKVISHERCTKFDLVWGAINSFYGKWIVGAIFVFLFVFVLVSDQQTPVSEAPLNHESGFSSEIASTQGSEAPDLVAFDPPGTQASGARPINAGAGQLSPKIAGPKLVRRVLSLNVPDGAMADAVLMTGAKAGPVKATLSSELRSRFGEHLLPSDATILGTAQATGDRLQIRFSKAILPDGDVVKISADALDSGDKTPGIKGAFIARQGLVLAGSIALNALSGVADGLQENEAVGAGIAKKANTRNALLNGASRASLDQAKELTQDFRESRKSIAVAAGTKIIVLFGEDSQGGS